MTQPTQPKAEAVRFNLNDYVRFKVRPSGREIYMAYYESLGMQPPELTADSDGYLRMQLWHVMNIFGASMRMGFDPPIETEVMLESSRPIDPAAVDVGELMKALDEAVSKHPKCEFAHGIDGKEYHVVNGTLYSEKGDCWMCRARSVLSKLPKAVTP